jgi:hypothetical protein
MRRIGSSIGSLFGGNKVEKAASGAAAAAAQVAEEDAKVTSVKERIAQLQQHAAAAGQPIKKAVPIERSVSCDFDDALGHFDGCVPRVAMVE